MLAVLAACGIRKKDDGAGSSVSGTNEGKDAGTSSVSGDEDTGTAPGLEDIGEAIDMLEDAGVDVNINLEGLSEAIENAEIAEPANARIMVDLAEGWVEREGAAEGTFEAIKDANLFSVVCAKAYGNADPVEYAKESIEQVKKILDKGEFSEVETINIDGTTGALYSFDMEIITGMPQRTISCNYFKNGLTVSVSASFFMTDESAAEKLEAEIRQMIASVRVEK